MYLYMNFHKCSSFFLSNQSLFYRSGDHFGGDSWKQSADGSSLLSPFEGHSEFHLNSRQFLDFWFKMVVGGGVPQCVSSCQLPGRSQPQTREEGTRDYSVQGGGASEALSWGGFWRMQMAGHHRKSRSESAPAQLKPRWSFLEAVQGLELAPGCEAAMLQTLGA